MAQASLPSPVGTLFIRGDGEALTSLTIGPEPDEEADDRHHPLLREAMVQLSAYFAGRLTAFDLPLAPPGTPRGMAHREAIAGVGYGEVASYGALARMLGSSPRAIGQACRRNPFPVIIPCHRVIGAGGAIGHYSGGQGIVTKTWLLDHERRHGKGSPNGFYD